MGWEGGVGKRKEGGGGEGGRCGDRKGGRQKQAWESVRGGVGRHGVTCGETWHVLAVNGLGREQQSALRQAWGDREGSLRV